MQNQNARATVVISLRVRKGREADYLAWQDEITERARGFEGFEGTEVFQPKEGVQEEWIVVYRFASAELLAAWLDSDARKAWIGGGDELFERIDEHVVATPRGESQPVTVVVSRKVKPGMERDFERWQMGIRQASSKFPGFVDAEHFRPVQGLQDDWVVVFRFANAETLDAWFRSEERQRWLDRVKPLVSEERMQRIGGGLGGWFPATHNEAESMPPDWKQAVAVLFALYPTVMLLVIVATPRMESMPVAVGVFLRNVVSVAFLTWAAMPVVNRLLGPWLRPSSMRASLLGSLAIFVAMAMMVVFFQFVI